MSLSRRDLLTRSVGAAALATVGAGAAVAAIPQVAPFPAAREGLGALVIEGEMVIFDAADFRLEPGDEAVVISPLLNNGRNGPMVRTIDGPTVQPCYWDRSAALEPLRDPEGRPTHYPIVYVLGRVVERRPLNAA